MRTFKANGAEWPISVNVHSIERVRDRCKVNLYTVIEDNFKLLKELNTDYFLLAAVLHALCKPEMEKRGVTDEQFAESLAGDALFDGFEKLVDEIMDFFPDPRQRKILKQMIEKIRTATGILMEEGEKRVNAIDPSIVLKSLSDSSGSSPESSGSTPAPSS